MMWGHRYAVIAVLILAPTACSRSALDAVSIEARDAMRSALSAQFRIEPADIRITSFERASWPDDCLGIRQERTCGGSETTGYRLQASIRNQHYEYRAAAADPSHVLLAAAPDPGIKTAALSWRWQGPDVGCESMMIGANGRAALGLCGAPHAVQALLPERDRLTEWLYFFDRFAPFDARSAQRTLSFRGQGKEEASAGWQGALLAWASLQWMEIQGGRSGAANGRAMTVREPIAGRPGFCNVLEVSEYGRAKHSVALCEGGGGEATRSLWLRDEFWEPFSKWNAEWTPLEEDGVQFFGQGTHAPTPGEAAMLRRLVRDEMLQLR